MLCRLQLCKYSHFLKSISNFQTKSVYLGNFPVRPNAFLSASKYFLNSFLFVINFNAPPYFVYNIIQQKTKHGNTYFIQ